MARNDNFESGRGFGEMRSLLRACWAFVGATLGIFATVLVLALMGASRCVDECHRYGILLAVGAYFGIAGFIVFRAVGSVRSAGRVRGLTWAAAWVLLGTSILLLTWMALSIVDRPANAGVYSLGLGCSVSGQLGFALIRRLAASQDLIRR
jgi:hypothetical protein